MKWPLENSSQRVDSEIEAVAEDAGVRRVENEEFVLGADGEWGNGAAGRAQFRRERGIELGFPVEADDVDRLAVTIHQKHVAIADGKLVTEFAIGARRLRGNFARGLAFMVELGDAAFVGVENV